MMTNNKVEILQIMNICWENEGISKEELFQYFVTFMKRSHFDDLISKMKRKHYIFEGESGIKTTITRENLQLDFDLVRDMKGGENPNSISGFSPIIR